MDAEVVNVECEDRSAGGIFPESGSLGHGLVAIEGLLHIAWHGDVDVLFGVTGKGEATVLCSSPID